MLKTAPDPALIKLGYEPVAPPAWGALDEGDCPDKFNWESDGNIATA